MCGQSSHQYWVQIVLSQQKLKVILAKTFFLKRESKVKSKLSKQASISMQMKKTDQSLDLESLLNVISFL
jgi:hypothetical protein